MASKRETYEITYPEQVPAPQNYWNEPGESGKRELH